jgi:uncharacterized protein YecE (DUF72 family)
VKGKFFIGTSGWSYKHWRDVFYPPEVNSTRWLPFYMEHFKTVEINNTFYHLPTEKAFRAWKETAPGDFTYALKASRFITHVKRLKDAKEPVELFLSRARILKENLGPVLFQLPPRWGLNIERLREFLRFLPGNLRFVFEFRDRSWFTDEVFTLLRKKDIALCIYSMPDFTSPVELTAPFTYIRFHGTGTLYGGRYTPVELKKWAATIKGFSKKGLDVYAYFNNDALGNAVFNAKELEELLKG